MPSLSPSEWSRQANNLQKKAGRPLDRQKLEKELGKPDGKVTRGQSLKKGGSWKPRTGNRKLQSITRGKGASTYTNDEAKKNASAIRKQARELSSLTIHQHGYGGKSFVGEHSQRIASGGIGDDLDSVSDPIFKEFKDSVEQKIDNQYGDKYIVDINEVTGYLRVIPRTSYNKEQYRSQQPGFDIEPDMDVDRVISALPFIVQKDLSVKNTSFPGLPSQPQELLSTPPTSYMQPTALGGFDMSRLPKPSNTAHRVPAFTPPSVYDYKNGNGNGNGNGASPPNGNGGNGDNYEQYLNPSPALQSIINDTFNYATHKTAPSLAEAAIKAGVGIVGFAKAVGSLALPYSP